jgi:predicted double-glycine peptidase
MPVIVNYIESDNDDGHYAVVIGEEGENLIMNDPWHGKEFKIDKTDFESRWKSEDGQHIKWIMVVSKTVIV